MHCDEELYYLKRMIIDIFEKMKEYADIFEEKNENRINFKKKRVEDFVDYDSMHIKTELTDSIHLFIDIVLLNELVFMEEDDTNLDFRKREKNKRSFYDKLFKYKERKDKQGNKGKYPINKCLNDLLGYRLIIKNDITLVTIYEKLKEFIDKTFSNKVSIYNASKLDYKGLHIYFKPSNFCFPCELQIWIKKDEKDNVKSHENYKQGYLYWEKYEKQLKKNKLRW